MRSIVGLWRWRGNPLCRRSDRREAWLALYAAVLMAVCVPLAGWLGGTAAYGSLLRTAQYEQHSRQQVWATVQSSSVRGPVNADPEPAGQRGDNRRALVQWRSADGRAHRAVLGFDHRVQRGDRMRVWTDRHGRLTARPLSARAAVSHSVLAGLAAGSLAAGTVEAGRRLAVRQLMRRRYADWDAEWQRIGPDWGRTGSNN